MVMEANLHPAGVPIGTTPPRGNANGGQSNAAAGPLGLRLVAIDAGRQMAEMERVFGIAGNCTRQMEALTTLRRWQFDPRLDSASRQRASALVWKFQPNGWDEV